ncbi:kunitz-type serine protease inhibitor DrTI-like [Andrographis paniculata]|uniref:kunitz-type serine protease inhibitor DrTI-like n=1 Tax=Andrographis paniculata TaxID=175694 RepID=UPI0021E9589D|nr:kunitz-type serine protease inhibitor DrTI-like [Andrographis paniculata]
MVIKLFSLSLLLILIHGVPAKSTPIRDSDGDEVKTGVEYYIDYAGFGFRGGIGLPGWSRLTCPSSVIQMQSEVDRGLPVTLQTLVAPANKISETTIYENSTVYVNFPQYVTRCEYGAAAWSVEISELDGKFLVVAGDSISSPSSQFRVVPAGGENVYSFEVCLPIAWLQCLKLGLSNLLGVDRLVVNFQTDEIPFEFKFVKKRAFGSTKKVVRVK